MMSTLGNLIGAAMRDARRAEDLLADGAARGLASDHRMRLDLFEVRALTSIDEAGARLVRAERREAGAREARRRVAAA